MSRVFALSSAALLLWSNLSFADAKVGDKAPDFKLVDSNGKTHSLADHKGKHVVLEWYNKDCPFVRKHYDTKNMQKLQESYTSKGVAWYMVSSAKKGKEGFVDGAQANETMKKEEAKATAFLFDPDGKVGKAYGAKTTPHMYIINGEGKLVYAGAIDSMPSTDGEDVKKATNYVDIALQESLANKPVKVAATKAYGCSVKY